VTAAGLSAEEWIAVARDQHARAGRATRQARRALEARDAAIRAAVAVRGVRPVARDLGLSATIVSRIARRA
jgi:hypothetical protein